MLSERAEEILEALWIQYEECGRKSLDLGASRDEPAIDELLRLGLVKVDEKHIHLLENGKAQAAGCVRRHRLAERLLADVFEIKKKNMEEVSCKFEHLLHEDLEEKVCSLLGHPSACPHGKPIPRGKCCLARPDKKSLKLIAPLTHLQVKDRGRVAYLGAVDSSSMQKLMSIGIFPGVQIVLLQKFPSYVISLGHSQFAIDEELAAAIFMRPAK